MSQTTEDGANPSAAAPSGLLVVTIDRLPAWMLAAYGSTWVATPAIDGLAARGIVFDRVITPTLDPHDTVRAIMHGGGDAGPALQATAAAAGWRVAVVTDDPVVADRVEPGPEDVVRLVEPLPRRTVAAEDGQTSIARLVDAAVDLLAAGEHRLVWCHVGSLGVSWDAPERYRDHYVDPEDPPPPPGPRVPAFGVGGDTDPDLVVAARQVFAGQVTLLDSQLGRLFAAVAGKADAARWAVLCAGVRGLPLGLHGWVGPGGRDVPYGELVHVPAILVDAAGRMAAQRYGGLVTPADLGCTLADLVADASGGRQPRPDLAATDPAHPWRGTSLAGLFDAWSSHPRDRVVVTGPDGVAIVTPAWHAVLLRDDRPDAGGGERVRLFAKPDDCFELADVADRCPGVVEPLAAVLASATAADARSLWLAELPPGRLD